MFETLLSAGNNGSIRKWRPSVMTPWATPASYYNGAGGTATSISIPGDPRNVAGILVTPGQGVAAPNTNRYGRILTDSGIWQTLGIEGYTGTQAIGVQVDDVVLFFGGSSTTQTGDDNKKVRQYNAATGVWTIIADLPITNFISNPSAARLGDWIVIAYCRESGSPKGTFIKYHIPTRTATRMADMLHNGRPADYGNVLSDGKNIYMLTSTTYLGGVTYEKIFRKFDPVTDTFTDLTPPPITTTSMPCGFAANGKMLVAGTVPGAVDYTTWMSYTPSTDTWDSWTVPPPLAPYITKRFCVVDNKLWVIGVASAAQRDCFYIPLT